MTEIHRWPVDSSHSCKASNSEAVLHLCEVKSPVTGGLPSQWASDVGHNVITNVIISGAWSTLREGEDINTAHVGSVSNHLAVGDNKGSVRLFRYPCSKDQVSVRQSSCLPLLCPICRRRRLVLLYYLSIIHNEMTRRCKWFAVYLTQSIPLSMMTTWNNEPGHQQPLCWYIFHGITQSRHQMSYDMFRFPVSTQLYHE